MNGYQAVDQGDGSTSHKTQGATVDRTFVLALDTTDRHLTYVMMTRHRDTVQLYAGSDEFKSEKALSVSLSRWGVKETTLDYRAYDGADLHLTARPLADRDFAAQECRIAGIGGADRSFASAGGAEAAGCIAACRGEVPAHLDRGEQKSWDRAPQEENSFNVEREFVESKNAIQAYIGSDHAGEKQRPTMFDRLKLTADRGAAEAQSDMALQLEGSIPALDRGIFGRPGPCSHVQVNVLNVDPDFGENKNVVQALHMISTSIALLTLGSIARPPQ